MPPGSRSHPKRSGGGYAQASFGALSRAATRWATASPRARLLDCSARARGAGPMAETTIAIAHQKGGVGKSTSAALLAAELAWLRPSAQILVEDLDPDRNLTSRWPGDTPTVHLVETGQGQGNVRVLDTGPGQTDRLAEVLRRADYVVAPVR